MILRILLILFFPILLTACNNNTSQNSDMLNNNSYSRLNNISPQTYEEKQYEPISVSGENESDKKDYFEPFGGPKKDYVAYDIDLSSPTPLASYTTKILTTDKNRYHNITLVRDRLDGFILKNNEIFSFNKVCGPYGKDDGFKEATILLSNGKEDKGYGGGVCQLSTTLYNAVKDLKIQITERHNHSAPVAYVPLNQDATVSLQSDLDFKFKNISGKDLRFEATSTPDSLTVAIYEK